MKLELIVSLCLPSQSLQLPGPQSSSTGTVLYKTNMFYLVLASFPPRGSQILEPWGRIFLLNRVLRDLVALPPLDFSHLTLHCAEKRNLGDLSFPMRNLGRAPSSWQSCGCWHGREKIPWVEAGKAKSPWTSPFSSVALRGVLNKRTWLCQYNHCKHASELLQLFLVFAWWADKKRNPGRREGDRQSLSDLGS